MIVGHRTYTIRLDGGLYPSEVSIEIHDSFGVQMFSLQASAASGDFGTINLLEGKTYSVVPFDSYGDGWNGAALASVMYGDSTQVVIESSDVTGEGGPDQAKNFTVCQDEVLFDAGHGGCSDYGQGGVNVGFCFSDGACNSCQCSCAHECSSIESVNNSPFFSVLNEMIHVFSEPWPVTFQDQVIVNISKGAPDEELSQKISFTIVGTTNRHMFLQLPILNSDGFIAFVVASEANGSSTISFFAVDDAGVDNGGKDTSEMAELTIKIIQSPCTADGTVVPLSVSGKVVCVPTHLAPSPSVQYCSSPGTWKQMKSHLQSGDFLTGFFFTVVACLKHYLCVHVHDCVSVYVCIYFRHSDKPL
jgi:hypothetical protein